MMSNFNNKLLASNVDIQNEQKKKKKKIAAINSSSL